MNDGWPVFPRTPEERTSRLLFASLILLMLAVIVFFTSASPAPALVVLAVDLVLGAYVIFRQRREKAQRLATYWASLDQPKKTGEDSQ